LRGIAEELNARGIRTRAGRIGVTSTWPVSSGLSYNRTVT